MIRTLHFSDFLKLGRLHEAEVGLNLPDSLVVPNSPLSAALAQRLPVQSSSSSVYIYEEDGKPEAFVQACARRRPEEWNVLALGVVERTVNSKTEEVLPAQLVISDQEIKEIDPSFEKAVGTTLVEEEVTNVLEEGDASLEAPPNSEETELAWLKLLEHLVMDAGEKGVARVFAKLSTESPELSLFSQTGFHSFTHESLLTLHHESGFDQPTNLNIRPQRKGDVWFIDQLYHSITPSFVKNSEQTLSRDWEIPKNRFPRNLKEFGWVIEEDEKVVAYIRVTSNRHRHILRIWNLDSQREFLPDLIRFALTNIKPGPNCYVYSTVREYQSEQERFLQEAGFNYFGKQALMVKHTVQYIRSPEKAFITGRDRKLELAPSVRPNLLARILTWLPFRYFLNRNFYHLIYITGFGGPRDHFPCELLNNLRKIKFVCFILPEGKK